MMYNMNIYLNLQTKVLSDNSIQANKKNAYVTFLCDDVMAEAAQVLVYSLKQTDTQHDIVVLVLNEVTQPSRDRLIHLGAKIINVNQIKYPWVSAAARKKGFNKACRYSKLNLWSLTQYQKIVFLDADTMVVQPLDELFDYPQFSAAVDIGGVLNTGVFVAEPNEETYRDIMATYLNAPSYNRGDQGFLNYYFNQTAHTLPGNYNLMVKFTHFSTLARSFIIQDKVKVLHFTSDTKPWNFHFLHHPEWRENYDGYLFGLWTKALRHKNLELAKAGLLKEGGRNQERVDYVCELQLHSNYGRRYPNTKQLTVILDLSSTTDTLSLEAILRFYASSKVVNQIFIRENQIQLDKTYLRKLRIRKPVNIIPPTPYPSSNNKFNPIQGIKTDAVLLVDGNMFDSVQEFEFAFDVWNKNKDSIVGYQPYSHKTVDSVGRNHQYNMMSSKMMLMKSDFLYAYSCLLPSQIHHYVDQHPDCLDVAINMLTSGMTGAAPLLVDNKFVNHSITSSLSGSNCIRDLTSFFDDKNTLVLNNQMVKSV
ncbi:Glycogenin-1 [Choanephora cucurbitarum]|uniref:Glycogenin-1 n=1 Tax=Choanephora cucurbitarum TaxID=101091 RepID=A0A1C7NQJ7_9FUNG|nr:Glycogenin-1 [Choanephora cucurbitarum]